MHGTFFILFVILSVNSRGVDGGGAVGDRECLISCCVWENLVNFDLLFSSSKKKILMSIVILNIGLPQSECFECVRDAAAVLKNSKTQSGFL